MAINFDWIYKSQFDVWNNNSAYWHNKATDLMRGSKILWESYKKGELLDGGDTYRMLMGLSFELLFKSFYVAEGEDVPNKHDLNILTKHCYLPLSQKEKQILGILTGYVLWEGRYPTPKKLQDINKQNDPFMNTLPIEEQLDGKSNQLLERSELDFELIIILWGKINNEYVEKYI